MNKLINENIPHLGMGCWAIGGKFMLEDIETGYGQVDDDISIKTIRTAYEHGVRIFDTAAVYGAGHSERIVGKALKGKEDAIIATKIGYHFNEETKVITGQDTNPKNTRQAVIKSLQRLQRDTIDIVFLHLNTLRVEQADEIFEALEKLVNEGLIRGYGWSTDFPENIRATAGLKHFDYIQHGANVFFDNTAIDALANEHDLWQFNRSPLAMGLLTGKFDATTSFAKNDIRGQNMGWMDYFKNGKVQPEFLQKLCIIQELLTIGGRSLVQGALGYLWAKSPRNIPIPGARTTGQAIENAKSLEFGALPLHIVDEIDKLIPKDMNAAPRER